MSSGTSMLPLRLAASALFIVAVTGAHSPFMRSQRPREDGGDADNALNEEAQKSEKVSYIIDQTSMRRVYPHSPTSLAEEAVSPSPSLESEPARLAPSPVAPADHPRLLNPPYVRSDTLIPPMDQQALDQVVEWASKQGNDPNAAPAGTGAENHDTVVGFVTPWPLIDPCAWLGCNETVEGCTYCTEDDMNECHRDTPPPKVMTIRTTDNKMKCHEDQMTLLGDYAMSNGVNISDLYTCAKTVQEQALADPPTCSKLFTQGFVDKKCWCVPPSVPPGETAVNHDNPDECTITGDDHYCMWNLLFLNAPEMLGLEPSPAAADAQSPSPSPSPTR